MKNCSHYNIETDKKENCYTIGSYILNNPFQNTLYFHTTLHPV